MKRSISMVLIIILSISLFAGCQSNASPAKIDLENSNYSIRENTTAPIESVQPSVESRAYLENYLEALSTAIDTTPAEIYTFDFSGVAFVSEELARNYLIPALIDKYGAEKIIEKTALEAIGIWAVPTAAGFENDVKELWISAFINPDGDLEFVIDILRDRHKLKNLRYVEQANGKLHEKQNSLTVNYDGTEPTDPPALSPEDTSASKTLYLSGRLQKRGIYELPVLQSLDFTMKLEGTPVPGGSLPGGFAGGFEGVVTIDGISLPLTLDGAGMTVPTGMVSDPAEYYIAFSAVGNANPQDTTAYRNVYFIKKDLSSVVGLYMFNKSDVYSDWYETTRISSSSYNAKIKQNNEKLTALYAKVITQTYGTRKEYNNMLAVIYNMFYGVELNYIKKDLKLGISSVSKDIRDYSEALKDSAVSRKGENGLYFFPDGRSMVVRLFAYDGSTAIAAIDFSSMQDNGYGALYKAEYTTDGWILTTLLNTRIK